MSRTIDFGRYVVVAVSLLMMHSTVRGQDTDQPAEASTAPDSPNAEESQEKPEREPIYHPEADAKSDIAAAIEKAGRDNKRVIVKWGGNWCGWCYRLHDFLHTEDEVARLALYNYEIVHVDVNSNQELLKTYDKEDTCEGFPFLTVLDGKGELLANQNTAELEEGQGYNTERVKAFLEKWSPEPLDAQAVLAAGLAKARAEQKHVLVHLGAPSCGWCRVLEAFLHEHADVIAKDYVDVKIDTSRMEHGLELARRLRSGMSGGIPWMVILDADGKELITSDGPEGNVGYPVLPREIEHFVKMLRTTARHMSDADNTTIEAALQDYAAKRKQQ